MRWCGILAAGGPGFSLIDGLDRQLADLEDPYAHRLCRAIKACHRHQHCIVRHQAIGAGRRAIRLAGGSSSGSTTPNCPIGMPNQRTGSNLAMFCQPMGLRDQRPSSRPSGHSCAVALGSRGCTAMNSIATASNATDYAMAVPKPNKAVSAVWKIGPPEGKCKQAHGPQSDPNRGKSTIMDSKTHTLYPQLIRLKRKGRQPFSV